MHTKGNIMRKTILLLLALMLTSCLSSKTADKMSPNTANKMSSSAVNKIKILPTSEYVHQFGEDVKVDGFWIPKDKDIKNIHITLKSALKTIHETSKLDWDVKETKKILDHFTEYRFQVVGVIIAGKKMLFCNAFPATVIEEEDWDPDSLYFVFDGGFWYWIIIIDPATKEVVAFSSNGYA